MALILFATFQFGMVDTVKMCNIKVSNSNHSDNSGCHQKCYFRDSSKYLVQIGETFIVSTFSLYFSYKIKEFHENFKETTTNLMLLIWNFVLCFVIIPSIYLAQNFPWITYGQIKNFHILKLISLNYLPRSFLK